MSVPARSGRLHVLVMAKAPVPGRVKTRLGPPCSAFEAAAIAEACLADTLAAVAACHAEHKVVALDGEPGSWLPPGIDVIAQRGASFGARLVNAWADMAPLSGGCGVQIGMDTPQITADLLDAQLGLLSGRGHAILGPAADGGWWLIGLNGTDPRRVFSGVPMSTATTGAAQNRRLGQLGLDVIVGPELADIDTIDDLWAVAATIPQSHTAAAARRLLRALDEAAWTEIPA